MSKVFKQIAIEVNCLTHRLSTPGSQCARRFYMYVSACDYTYVCMYICMYIRMYVYMFLMP